MEPGLSEADLLTSVDNLQISENSEKKLSDSDMSNSGVLAMPKPIRKSILKQNVKFLHNR